MRIVISETDEKPKVVLNDEQMHEFIRIRDELRDNMRARAGLLE